jgi:hypothetical protein
MIERQKLRLSALCILGSAMVALAQPAAAAPLLDKGLAPSTLTNVEPVRYGGWHHNGWRHGWHRGAGWRRGYYRPGPALGALAAGAIIGSAIASSQARMPTAVAYCEQRFKSYDPASGTYLGYDGERHACP